MDAGVEVKTADVVAINEQKVAQLERVCAQLLVDKLENEKLAIDNALAYFRERMPRLVREIEEARARCGDDEE